MDLEDIRFRQYLLIAGAAVSAIWLALCGWYIHTNIGWQELLLLLPHELGAFIVGIFAPLAFVWVAFAYILRGRELHDTTEMLRAELQRLTYPAEDADERVHAVTESLRAQAEELGAVSDRAVNQAQMLRENLQAQSEHLETVSSRVAERALLVQDSVERQTRNMEETTRESLDRLQSVGEEFANVVAEFGPRAQHAA
jgi:DNA anti-recombination protein RmuC